MKEAVGGTVLLKIVLVFLIIYIMFMAIVLKYGRTFRIKNALINQIEQHEGFTTLEEIEEVARSLGYFRDLNACYVKLPNDRGYYYKIEIFAQFDLPLITNTLNIPVTGETRTINTGNVTPRGWECK